MTLIERATELLKPIANYWSTNYVIKYGNNPDALAYIDFQNIFVNSEYNCLSDVQLQALLLHEYGHRFIAPGKISSRQRKEITNKTFELCGIDLNKKTSIFDSKIKIISMLLNIAYDLIVDRYYIKDTHWKAIYTDGFIKINYDIFTKSLSKDHHSLNKQQRKLYLILSGITLFNLISKKETLKEHRPNRKHCKPFLKIIHNKKLEVSERVSQFVFSLFILFDHEDDTILFEQLSAFFKLVVA